MGAVWTEPQQRYGPPAGGPPRVDLVDVLDEVPRRRVVRRVQRDRLRAVVDRDVRRPPDRPADAGRGTATAGKEVHDEFVGPEEGADARSADVGHV